MTIYAFEAQETWLPTVIGLACSAVEIDDNILSIHFGETRKSVSGYLEADRTISMIGVWRVEQGDEIIAGSGDLIDPDRAERLRNLVESTLDRVEVSHPGFDLSLFLSDDLVIRSFPCDSHDYAEDIEDDQEINVAWWVDGAGVPDDWEEPNESFFDDDETAAVS